MEIHVVPPSLPPSISLSLSLSLFLYLVAFWINQRRRGPKNIYIHCQHMNWTCCFSSHPIPSFSPPPPPPSPPLCMPRVSSKPNDYNFLLPASCLPCGYARCDVMCCAVLAKMMMLTDEGLVWHEDSSSSSSATPPSLYIPQRVQSMAIFFDFLLFSNPSDCSYTVAAAAAAAASVYHRSSFKRWWWWCAVLLLMHRIAVHRIAKSWCSIVVRLLLLLLLLCARRWINLCSLNSTLSLSLERARTVELLLQGEAVLFLFFIFIWKYFYIKPTDCVQCNDRAWTVREQPTLRFQITCHNVRMHRDTLTQSFYLLPLPHTHTHTHNDVQHDDEKYWLIIPLEIPNSENLRASTK